MKFSNKYLKKFSSLAVTAKIILLALMLVSTGIAQNNDAAENEHQVDADTTAKESPTPIPFPEIVQQAENATASLAEITASVSGKSKLKKVEKRLPELTDEINAKLKETARISKGLPSLENLQNLETEWKTLMENLPEWKTNLAERAVEFEDDLAQLRKMQEKWTLTFEELNKWTQLPPEITVVIEKIISDSANLQRQIEAEQAKAVSLQSRVVEQQRRVFDALKSLRQTRKTLIEDLFVQDSPAIWQNGFWIKDEQNAAENPDNTFLAQTIALGDFARRNFDKFIIHFAVFILFVVALFVLSRRVRFLTKSKSKSRNSLIIFRIPLATALISAILMSSWIYPSTTRMLDAIFGAVALVPIIIILRKLVARPLYPVFYALLVFYLLDQIQSIAELAPIYTRLFLLAEMLGGFLFLLWFIIARLSVTVNEKKVHDKFFLTIKYAALIALPFFAVSFLANVLGYVSLAQLSGNSILRLAYTAVIFYGIVKIVDGWIFVALRFRPLNQLQMVKDKPLLIHSQLAKLARFIAFAAWLLTAPKLLALREPLFEWVRGIVTSKLTLGSLSISLGDILLFVAAIWAAIILSRVINFVLREDIYPRFSLETGVPYAISTVLHYVILLLGFLFAIAAAGFDLTKFTVLAGAFGVGIGFGLQNVINNFVSGIILLFERPIKVGDWVKIGDSDGYVQHIGIRASLVQDWDETEIIVPNSKLISENVTNFTYESKTRGIAIPASVIPNADLPAVIKLLKTTVAAHPLIIENPSPKVLLEEATATALNFKVRVWTEEGDKTTDITSELLIAVNQAIAENNLAVPRVKVLEVNLSEKI